MKLRRTFFLGGVIASVFMTVTLAYPVVIGGLSIAEYWIRPSTGVNTAAYLTIENNSDQPDKLVKVECQDSKSTELHDNINDNGVMRMRPVSFIGVDKKSTVSLRPGGLHIMLMGLESSFYDKDKIPLTLHFEKAGPVTIDFLVKQPDQTKSGG